MTGVAPSCRLDVLLASGSARAVVFRRGPAKETRLIAWDRATDGFEPGQWLRRTRVYAERSSLSPDGEHLLAFVGRFRPPIPAYTVLSRPPYFTALALWPSVGTWSRGGVFLGDRSFVLFQEQELAPGFEPPAGFTLVPRGPAVDARLAEMERRSGWRRLADEPGGWRAARDGAHATLLVGPPAGPDRFGIASHALRVGARELPLAGAAWADFDDNGDLLFAVEGALFRCPAAALARLDAAPDIAAASRQLADFAAMRFEPVRAPYPSGQGTAGEDGAFAPRLDRVSKEDRRRRALARRRERDAARRGDGRP